MLYGQYKNVLKQDAYRIESPTTFLLYFLSVLANIGVVVVDFGEVTHIGTAFLQKYIKYC